MSEKRRDSKNRILRTGESQEADVSSDTSMPTENASLCIVGDWWQRIAYQPEKEIMRLCGNRRRKTPRNRKACK